MPGTSLLLLPSALLTSSCHLQVMLKAVTIGIQLLLPLTIIGCAVCEYLQPLATRIWHTCSHA